MSNEGVSADFQFGSEVVQARKLQGIQMAMGYGRCLGLAPEGSALAISYDGTQVVNNTDSVRLGFYYTRSRWLVVGFRYSAATDTGIDLTITVRDWGSGTVRATESITIGSDIPQGTDTYYYALLEIPESYWGNTHYVNVKVDTLAGEVVDLQDWGVWEVPWAPTNGADTTYTGPLIAGGTGTIYVRGYRPYTDPSDLYASGLTVVKQPFIGRDGLSDTKMDAAATAIPRMGLLCAQAGLLEEHTFSYGTTNTLVYQVEANPWAGAYMALVYETKKTGANNVQVFGTASENGVLFYNVTTGASVSSGSYVLNADVASTAAVGGGIGDMEGQKLQIGIIMDGDGAIRNLRVYYGMTSNPNFYLGAIF